MTQASGKTPTRELSKFLARCSKTAANSWINFNLGHYRVNWQDPDGARAWDADAWTLDKTAEKLRV